MKNEERRKSARAGKPAERRNESRQMPQTRGKSDNTKIKPEKKRENAKKQKQRDAHLARKKRKEHQRQAVRTSQQRPAQKKRREKRTPTGITWLRTSIFANANFRIKIYTMLAVVVAILLGFTIFFKAQNVVVSGNRMYSAQEIVEASGIETGDNLLTIGKAKIAGNILAELSYIKEVRVGIKMPDTVNIDITEVDAVYAVASDDGMYWLVNRDGKLLEPVTAKDADAYLMLKGFTITGAEEGKQMVAKEDNTVPPASENEEEQSGEAESIVAEHAADKLQTAMDILNMVAQTPIAGEISVIDVSSLYDIEIWYGEQYQILFGTTDDLSYKVEYMAAAIGELESYQSGVIDLTFETNKVARFTPW